MLFFEESRQVHPSQEIHLTLPLKRQLLLRCNLAYILQCKKVQKVHLFYWKGLKGRMAQLAVIIS